MRRKLFLYGVVLSVLLCSSSVVSVEAASVWSQTYGGTGTEKTRSLVVTPDGGYAVVGFTDSFGAGDRDFWLVKTDALGGMEWNRTYGGAGADEAWGLAVTSDGGYAIAGNTNSFGAGNYDFWLVKTDANGSMKWNKTYGGTKEEWVRSLVATSDGGYALAGDTESFGAGRHDFWLVKTDALGNMQWNKTYGGTEDDYAHSVVATPDGGYAVAGDGLLVKTDAFGNVEWNTTWGGPIVYEEANSLIVTPDGGYALAGSTTYAFWLAKTDSYGTIQWSKTYTADDNAWAYSLVATPDGGYALAGSTVHIRSSKVNFLLVKTNANGNMEWNRTYGIGDAHSLVITSDGGYAIAASTKHYFEYSGGDFILIKTDEAGVIPEYPPCVIPLLMLTVTALIIINKKRLIRTR